MSQIPRREFLERTAVAAGATMIGLPALAREAGSAPPAGNDRVTLGKTGIKLSRLGMGTGTRGGREQRDLKVKGLADLLKYGYDRGLNYWDLADAYKTHPHAREALKTVPRDKVVILTKSRSKTAAAGRADVERFLKELDTDHVDICLLHCMQDSRWTTKMRGPMDVLSEAKAAGKVRAVGCSCHTVEALEAAAASDWIDVVLARINHDGAKMDAKPDKVVPVLAKIKAAGKGVLGMKILGEGTLGAQRRKSLNFVLNLGTVDAFNIGFSKSEQIDDILSLIPKAAASA